MILARCCRWPIAGLMATALALGCVPGRARADGDPASDVLVSAPPLFLSTSSRATFAQEQGLDQQLRVAARDGRAVRVAVIATRSDLGSITALWSHPQAYAVFLGRELSLDYRGELLVVMPAGFGVVRDGELEPRALAGLAPRSGQLLEATEQAVERLTGVAPAGRRVSALAAAPGRLGGIGWWVATGVALLLLGGAWAASLRRRPPRRHSTDVRRAGH